MDARDDRKAMAGMLQRAVTAARDTSGKDCPGADLLAAYYEQALTPAERLHWEAHFSSCGLCQAQLAALARSEPQPQPGPLWSWRRHWTWKWLPPAAAALTAVAIWIAVRPNNPLRHFEKKPLEVATTAAVSPNQQQELKEATRAESPASPPESTSKAKASAAPGERQQEKAAKTAGGSSESAAATRSKEEMARDAMARSAPGIVVKKAELPPSVGENATPAGEAVAPAADKAAQSPASSSMSVEVTAGAPAPTPPASTRAESSSAKVRAGYAAGGAPGAFRASGGSGGLQVLEVRSAEVPIPSPDPAVQWRIGRGGIIERTVDGGATWNGQFVNGRPGLAAGSAPSTKVCWVVGRAGTILRTKDGENWEKIAPPAPLDFTGIKARDEKTATITAADGRNFSTENGGKTWQLVQQNH